MADDLRIRCAAHHDAIDTRPVDICDATEILSGGIPFIRSVSMQALADRKRDMPCRSVHRRRSNKSIIRAETDDIELTVTIEVA